MFILMLPTRSIISPKEKRKKKIVFKAVIEEV